MTQQLRAGILVTGTEVLTGIISDRNGPWLSEKLREVGADVAQITVVGDRPADLLDALGAMAESGIGLIITSGGLGPTADDLTAQVVADFQKRPMELDEALEERIAAILAPLSKRWPNLDQDAVRAANRKQAFVPQGATVLEPVGTAPGLIVPPLEGTEGPTVIVLPGPPRELQPMWEAARATQAFASATVNAKVLRREMIRLFGMPESELAMTLRKIEDEGLDLSPLEITTCLRRGEIEIATSFDESHDDVYGKFSEAIIEAHGDLLFSTDSRTIDQIVAGMLAGHTLAVAESCTAGLIAGRLTDQPGSSSYLKGGLIVYSNEAKARLAGVPTELIDTFGAVSSEVCLALAEGARQQLDAQIGLAVTGIAGPQGGSAEKPVGLVWFAVVADGIEPIVRSVQLPGGRTDVRDRSTTVAMHMLHRALKQLNPR